MDADNYSLRPPILKGRWQSIDNRAKLDLYYPSESRYDKMEVIKMALAKNPILAGFYPDPSICAVGHDFYLVNSTFSYFPGIPVWHSRDLAHWEQIGNVMERESQLPLYGCGHSEGLFAPSIRYDEGTFYVACTNVSGGGSFIVTAADPAGPWSEPYYLEGAAGIDPSLFFDDDGSCYYIGTHPNPEGCRYDGDWYLWIQELDLKTMRLIGKAKDVWHGAMRRVVWPEGPHLYKKNGYYYILYAEGGTESHHAVAVCRSRSILGPYENNPCNPILTHRHLGQSYPIQCVGHGDLVETPSGEWYMVLLATRPLEGCTTLGRETFLARVVWENDWPVVNPGVGRLTSEVETGLAVWEMEKAEFDGRKCYRFGEMKRLDAAFLFLRNPDRSKYRLCSGEGLRLSYGGCLLTRKASPVYLGLRQRHHCFRAEAVLDLPVSDGETGIALLQNNEYHLRLALIRPKGTEEIVLRVYLCEKGIDHLLAKESVSVNQTDHRAAVRLTLEVRGIAAAVEAYGGCGEAAVLREVDIRSLSTETAGGFAGCTVGLYAAGGCETDPDIIYRSFLYDAEQWNTIK